MIIVVIPAKGGSKRLPKKNMANLLGRPMLEYAINDAKASKRADEIYVSTDDGNIDLFAKSMGINVIRRPKNLGGEVPIIEVYRHAIKKLNHINIKILVGLQPDHPDRVVTIDQALEYFEKENADRLFSKNANGEKNGAHYILSRQFIDTDQSRKDIYLIDDCTNVHYESDLKEAESKLRKKLL